MEVVLALTIVGMLAVLAVPHVRTSSGVAALKARANEIASLLRRDRNMALHLGRNSVVLVDAGAGTLRSGLLGQSVVVPDNIKVRLKPDCATGVSFAANGSSSGASIVLAAQGASISVDINRLTSAIRISEIDR
jgi:type II secretory pathway pseudopilin PulG